MHLKYTFVSESDIVSFHVKYSFLPGRTNMVINMLLVTTHTHTHTHIYIYIVNTLCNQWSQLHIP